MVQVRRVVTGHDVTGRAVVESDRTIAGRNLPDGAATFAVIWRTVQSPVNNDDAVDRASEPVALVEENGSILRVVDTPPGSCSPMHRTNSLDYGIVLEGNVELELDDGQITTLTAGDIVVQRGTIHAWRNPGPGNNRMAFVLLSALPATVNGERLPPVHHDIAPTE